MSELYKATSPKNPDFNNTQEVVFEKDGDGNPTKSIRVGGEPVALDDDQLESARKYLNVRKATDEEKAAMEGDPNDVVSESEEDRLATEDQVSTVPQVPAPNSPAAAEARTEHGKRRAGGDK